MELRPYQKSIAKKAADIIDRLHIVYLALEPRVGKTLTALTICELRKAARVLFVTKKKAINDIVDQAARMGYDFELFVTNYEQLHNVNYGWDIVVIDEAHSIGAFPIPSLRAKELRRICKATPIVYLSGTPSPESYSQLYHQFWVSSFSPWKEYPTFYKWAIDHVNIKTQWIGGKPYKDYKEARIDEINKTINKYMISFTQEQAGFESFVDEVILNVRMEQTTYNLAKLLRKNRIVRGKDEKVIIADTGAKMMQKLHQIYSGTCICEEPEREAIVFDYTKAQFIRHYFKGKRIAIFYKFAAEFHALNWTFGGKMTMDVDHFQNGQSDVVALQILSGREGINLDSADCLVFYNIDFSATSYFQARARLQTKNRKTNSKIYWIFSEDGIEKKIYDRVKNKEDYTINHYKLDFQ